MLDVIEMERQGSPNVVLSHPLPMPTPSASASVRGGQSAPLVGSSVAESGIGTPERKARDIVEEVAGDRGKATRPAAQIEGFFPKVGQTIQVSERLLGGA